MSARESSVSGSGGNHKLFLMIMVVRKLIQKKFQSLMEILKSFPGGKPTSTIIPWA